VQQWPWLQRSDIRAWRQQFKLRCRIRYWRRFPTRTAQDICQLAGRTGILENKRFSGFAQHINSLPGQFLPVRVLSLISRDEDRLAILRIMLERYVKIVASAFVIPGEMKMP